MSISALSSLLKEFISFPSVFQTSNNPPTSSPIVLDGFPSIITIDLPFLLCPVTIRLKFSIFVPFEF